MCQQASMLFVILFSSSRIFSPLSHLIWGDSCLPVRVQLNIQTLSVRAPVSSGPNARFHGNPTLSL